MFTLGGLGLFTSCLIRANVAGEVVGYIGRVGSSYNVTYNNFFIAQLCALIIAPAFFSAGLYATIGIMYSSVTLNN